MKRALRNPWLEIGFDAYALALESSAVIGLRVLKMAQGGPGTQAEAHRMVSEKVAAAASLQAKALTGGLGATPESASASAIAHYRRIVAANHRRLSQS